ncbi:MAG: phosphoenolpyruvate--protein phosphotransferase [Lachnospiraceae bacterium]|nr:phosphoenolpyruvate--protein phosphotransferase [Lachnospiraceae bacterium]
MKIYKGKSVFGGIAIGKIQVYGKGEKQVKRVKVEDTEAEILRYRQASEEARSQLAALYDRALQEVGEDNAAIFEIHQMMLEDGDYQDSIENIIRTQTVNAEYAVARTADNFAQMFAAMEDDYMRGRAADVRDISERLLSILQGEASDKVSVSEPVIIVADDLAPSETVQFDKDMVLSFVTVHGSRNSHTAILARTMGIPALVGAGLPLDGTVDGKTGIVDGTNGVIYVEPDEETLSRLQKAGEEEQEKKAILHTLKGKENITLDGKGILLYANIGNIKELATVLQNDAGGIGLFRSEFIYLEREDFPTEEEQFWIYRTVAETMGKKRVIIRTLDIGADKQCDYFRMEKEENPALGCRAIRICLTRPEIFKTQLRALFRASKYGKIAIMYPMITSAGEVRRIREIVGEVKAELTARGIEYGEPEQGIMIETPAAAIISDQLAGEVDFFSIGTNDLTQYLLAVDRQNPALDEFCDTHHPAVLRMIELVVENAHRAGIWAGICGELGADPELTRDFLAMGVDELSVSPERILPIRRTILETNVSEYKKTWQKSW